MSHCGHKESVVFASQLVAKPSFNTGRAARDELEPERLADLLRAESVVALSHI
jgi:hypothetical protein